MQTPRTVAAGAVIPVYHQVVQKVHTVQSSNNDAVLAELAALKATVEANCKEIEHLKAQDAWNKNQISLLEQQLGDDVNSLRGRMVEIEAWDAKLTELSSSHETMLARHEAFQATFDTLHERVEAVEKPPKTELEMRVAEIEAREHVHFDLLSGRMDVLKDISFKPLKTSDEPIAELKAPDSVVEVLDDVAELGSLFPNNVMLIEGHTAGGESDFWQCVAENRARLVAQEIVKRGHREDNVRTVGYPGKRGLNKSEVVVKLQMSAEDRKAMRQSVNKR